MTQDDKNIAEQPTENSSLGSADQAGVKQPASVKSHASDLASEIEKELAHVSATLQEETKTIAANALELTKHPRRSAELGASLAEGMAGESLGEIVEASLGTIFGPEGTVIGAEVVGMAGEVFGARQGGKIAKELLHQPETEHPLKEDLQKEGGDAGKIIGGHDR
ncbi:MAG: hypothetical protein WCH01_14795 [Methylococcaceae bacterium]